MKHNRYLIFKNKKYQIPRIFLSINDVNQEISNCLKIKGIYEVCSKVSEEVFKSFIDHWTHESIPQISLNNIYEYEQISQEFDRMHDLIELYQQKRKDIIISPILRQNQELRRKYLEKVNHLNEKKAKYNQIIQILFKNQYFNAKEQFNEIKEDLKKECQQENVEFVELMTRKRIKLLGFSFILNENEKTAILFHNDSNNKEIIIPRSIRINGKEEFIITSIAEKAFMNERTIETIKFSENSEIKTIGKNAFSYTLLENVSIPSSVTNICEFSFSNCFRLQTINFSENSELRIIENNSFAFSPIKSISIPSSIDRLKEGWCCGTINLTEINIFPNKNQNNICFYNENYILGKLDNKSDKFNVLVFARRNIEHAEIPDFIKVIAPFAFHKCVNLKNISFSENSELERIDKSAFSFSSLESILIPLHVFKICESSFSSCFKLKYVKFVDNSELKIIEKSSFACSSLEEISIPSHVKRIDELAFSSCYKLKKFDIPENSELISIEKDAFINCAIENITSIPSSLIEFKSTFSNLTSIKIIQKQKANISYYDNKLILGKSDLKSDIFDIVYFARRDIKNVTIPSFIKQIAPYAFSECKQLQKVDFSENSELNSIEDFAFSLSSIEFISIPSTVIKICGRAFFNCDKLKKVDFKSNSKLLSIDDYSFSYSKIEKISIPSKVNRIGEFAFSCCYFLKKVIFAGNPELKMIDKSAFYFTSINNILIPPRVTKISNLAFSYCQNLKIIEISENSNLKTINKETFDTASNIIIMTPAKLFF